MSSDWTLVTMEEDLRAFIAEAAKSEPVVFVNGRRFVLSKGQAETTLLQFLRANGLTGTKLGCGEGGCGACTVMVSRIDGNTGRVSHLSVNACLAPLYSVEGAAVVTVEGIGSTRTALHPVQQSLSSSHGSQCGFCTPGFVMSMYTLLRQAAADAAADGSAAAAAGGRDTAAAGASAATIVSPSPRSRLPSLPCIEEALSGNLCRCTGYRPILDAFRVFARSDAQTYTRDAVTSARNAAAANDGAARDAAAGSGLLPGAGSSGGVDDGKSLLSGGVDTFICPSTGLPCACGDGNTQEEAAGKEQQQQQQQEVEEKTKRCSVTGCCSSRGAGAAVQGGDEAPLVCEDDGNADGNADGGGTCSGAASQQHQQKQHHHHQQQKQHPPLFDSQPIFPPELSKRGKHAQPLCLGDVQALTDAFAATATTATDSLAAAAAAADDADAAAAAALPVTAAPSNPLSPVWFRPITLRQLLLLRAAYPQAKVVAGNSEVGIEVKFKGLSPPAYIHTSGIAELASISQSEAGMTVGAAASLSSLRAALLQVVEGRGTVNGGRGAVVDGRVAVEGGHVSRRGSAVCAAMAEQLRWFAGVQIRNVATLAGNIVTASPISDLNPILIAANATFTIASLAQADDSASLRQIRERQVAARDFFKGYRQVDLREGEVLTAVFIPWTPPHEHLLAFKQSHRKDDDIALVNAAIRVRMDGDVADGAAPSVVDASLVFGGVAATTLSANQTQAWLVGRRWTEETLKGTLRQLAGEVHVPESAPGGMSEFRRSLVASFFFKFFVHVARSFQEGGSAMQEGTAVQANQPICAATTHSASGQSAAATSSPPSWPPPSFLSASDPLPRPYPHGVRVWERRKGEGGEGSAVVGVPVVHLSADLQVSGEAEYTDDTPLPPSTLHGALVLSTRPHARILAVDQSDAASCPGFAGLFTHTDVPGSNCFGAVTHDEEVFAAETVKCVGQIIALVVADSHQNARAAAKKVCVTYQDLPAVLTIQEAVDSGSFHEFPFSGGSTMRQLTRNGGGADGAGAASADADVDAVLAGVARCPLVVEGDVSMGGQEHFYLEPNSCVVWPVDGGREMHMVASTQAPTHHQRDVAAVLGIPMHRVVSKAKRLGGGFGGKETRSVLIAAAAAVAAWRLQRGVKVTLDRDDDMRVTGQRHPFQGKYKVGFTPAGRILASSLLLTSNAGCSLDLSAAVLERALFHCDSVYATEWMRARGRMARTNLPSNTAFRGFGGPQGMQVAENIIDHVARAVGKTPEEIRELNLQPEGWRVHFGQPLSSNPIRRIWSELQYSSDFAARRLAASSFNSLHRWKKRGLAMVPTKFGISFTAKFLNQGGALVHAYSDGTVLVTHGGVEMGQGLHTKCAQIAAQTLGVPMAAVFISETSTDKVPNTSPTAASASSDIYGRAVLDACEEIKRRMRPIRERHAGESFAQIAQRCHLDRVSLSAQGFHATPDIHFDWSTSPPSGSPFAYFTFGAAAAEVEVDVLTGDVTIARADILMDVGRSLNPAIDIGQIEGAFVQGIGWSVVEEVKWGDAAHPWVPPGALFTSGPGTYKIPSASDIPTDFRVALLTDAPNPRAVLSSKAVGEPPCFLGSSVMWAIKDAIYAARKDAGHTGFFRLDIPATPERIRMACADDITSSFCGPNLLPKLSC